MTIKAITATVAIVTFLAADGAVQAEQIKGQHVSSDNGHTIVTDNGTHWNIDGGIWYESQTGETAIVTPDAPQIEVPISQPQLVPQPIEQKIPILQPPGEHLDGQHIAPELVPQPIEQKTPTLQSPGEHLDGQHIAPELVPQPIEQKTPTLQSPGEHLSGQHIVSKQVSQPIDAIDPTEEINAGGVSMRTPKESPVTIKKLIYKDINQVLEASYQTQGTYLGASITIVPSKTKSAIVAKKSIFRKSALLPTTGDSKIISLITSGLGAFLVSTLLFVFIYKNMKRKH
ncbi:LPXTG cell wall anchor domain-containing protein [Lactococcus garvieae]|uniref:LPXTG cell wall anchor domain-containing protein n=1 Tax=Lactococcus garvieae TaxID=1363 RepID=UPI0030CCDB23